MAPHEMSIVCVGLGEYKWLRKRCGRWAQWSPELRRPGAVKVGVVNKATKRRVQMNKELQLRTRETTTCVSPGGRTGSFPAVRAPQGESRYGCLVRESPEHHLHQRRKSKLAFTSTGLGNNVSFTSGLLGVVINIHVTPGRWVSVEGRRLGRGHPELKRRWRPRSAGLSSL